MFCSKCGAEIGNQESCCPKCGAAVGEKKKGTAVPAVPRKEVPGRKKLLAGVAVLAVLAVTGIIVLAVHLTSPEYRSGKCVKTAEKYMQEGAFQEAIEAYRKALEYLPENAAAEEGLEEAYLGAADALYQEERYDEAMECYETVKGLNPARFEVYLGESDIYLQSDDVIAALDVLEEGKESTDGNVLTAREEYIKEHTTAYVSQAIYYSDGDEITRQYMYEYNERGNVTKVISYNADGSVYSWREYEYDESGNEIKFISYNADGSVGRWIEYEYDERGNEIKRISYNADGSIRERSEYGYTISGINVATEYIDIEFNISNNISYDEAHDSYCIKEVEYDKNGNVEHVWHDCQIVYRFTE